MLVLNGRIKWSFSLQEPTETSPPGRSSHWQLQSSCSLSSSASFYCWCTQTLPEEKRKMDKKVIPDLRNMLEFFFFFLFFKSKLFKSVQALKQWVKNARGRRFLPAKIVMPLSAASLWSQIIQSDHVSRRCRSHSTQPGRRKKNDATANDVTLHT